MVIGSRITYVKPARTPVRESAESIVRRLFISVLGRYILTAIELEPSTLDSVLTIGRVLKTLSPWPNPSLVLKSSTISYRSDISGAKGSMSMTYSRMNPDRDRLSQRYLTA